MLFDATAAFGLTFRLRGAVFFGATTGLFSLGGSLRLLGVASFDIVSR